MRIRKPKEKKLKLKSTSIKLLQTDRKIAAEQKFSANDDIPNTTLIYQFTVNFRNKLRKVQKMYQHYGFKVLFPIKIPKISSKSNPKSHKNLPSG